MYTFQDDNGKQTKNNFFLAISRSFPLIQHV